MGFLFLGGGTYMAGSIQKRGNNKYLLTVSAGTGVDGKRIRYTKTVEANSEYEAKKLLALFVAEVETGKVVDDKKLTLQGFSSIWMNEYAEKQLSPKTIEHYYGLLDRINYALGHIRLNKLKPTHLMQFYNMLREDGIRADGRPGGLSETTIAHYHRLLSAMLNTAVEWELLSNNPASKVKKPKASSRKDNYYDADQTKKLFDALKDEPLKYRLAVNLAVFAGMRLGEIKGLEWDDIDFDKCQIYVKRASQHTVREGTFDKEPKQESKRAITVPKEVIKLLSEHKVEQNKLRLKKGSKWIDSNKVFTQNNGKPMYPKTVSHWFTKFIRRKKLPYITFHGLRHTNATLLISENVDIRTVSNRLGHAKTSTTLDIYAHVIEKIDQGAADKLSNLFSKKA